MVVETTRTSMLPVELQREDTENALHDTAQQYYWCHNQTSNHCWGAADEKPNQPDDLKATKRGVHDDIYSRLKDETELNANLVQAAVKQISCRATTDGGVIRTWCGRSH